MTKLTIDDNGMIRIPDVTVSVEFCDKSGKTVGYFHPIDDQDSVYATLKCPVSDEELNRRAREESWSTLAEIWQRIDPK